MELKDFLQKQWDLSNYSAPTKIQAESFNIIQSGRDLIAESPTGTGKTLAYLLPIINNIDENETNPQVVILAPSRELVMQIFDVAQNWSQPGGVKVASFIGGVPIKRQLEKIKKKPQVIIGTPGRIGELITQKKLKMHKVRTIVLDEGDQLLVPEHKKAIEQVIKSTLSERQVVLFSATLSKEFTADITSMMKNPEVIRVERAVESKGNVDFLYFECDRRDKIIILEKLIKVCGIKALAFANDIKNINVIEDKLHYKGVNLATLHGDASKPEREMAIKGFRSGDYDLLLATDIVARGIDIDALPAVIHYDLPRSADQFIHRSGRTGRQGASGTVISIIEPSEKRELQKFVKELDVKLEKVKLYQGGIVSDNN